MTIRLLITAVALLLAGCEIPGLGPDPRIAQREAEANAIGGACRHGLRGIEDCYNLNADAPKAAIFAGWKEMDQYMRENKIEGQRSAEVAAEPEEKIIEEQKATAGATDKASAPKPGQKTAAR